MLIDLIHPPYNHTPILLLEPVPMTGFFVYFLVISSKLPQYRTLVLKKR